MKNKIIIPKFLTNWFDMLFLCFVENWTKGREMMEISVSKNENILNFGVIGLYAALRMLKDLVFWLVTTLFYIGVAIGGIFVFLIWLSYLIVHPFITIPITLAVLAPIIVGCICGCRIANKMDKDNCRLLYGTNTKSSR